MTCPKSRTQACPTLRGLCTTLLGAPPCQLLLPCWESAACAVLPCQISDLAHAHVTLLKTPDICSTAERATAIHVGLFFGIRAYKVLEELRLACRRPLLGVGACLYEVQKIFLGQGRQTTLLASITSRMGQPALTWGGRVPWSNPITPAPVQRHLYPPDRVCWRPLYMSTSARSDP